MDLRIKPKADLGSWRALGRRFIFFLFYSVALLFVWNFVIAFIITVTLRKTQLYAQWYPVTFQEWKVPYEMAVLTVVWLPSIAFLIAHNFFDISSIPLQNQQVQLAEIDRVEETAAASNRDTPDLASLDFERRAPRHPVQAAVTSTSPQSSHDIGLNDVGTGTQSPTVSSLDSPALRKPPSHPKTNRLGGSVRKIKSGDSWAAVRKLNALSLQEVLENHLTSNTNRDASLFISVNDLPLDGSAVGSPMEAFVSYCISLKQWESQEIINHVHWLFMTLMVGDIGRLMFGRYIIIEEGRKDELKAAVERRCSRLQDIEKAKLGLGTQDLASKIYQASQTMLASGDKLVWLCDKFGTGCLFWLSQTLTNPFITDRFTREGYAYEDAMAKLKELQLAETAEASGANAMGDAIRNYLRQVYRVDEIGFDRL